MPTTRTPPSGSACAMKHATFVLPMSSAAIVPLRGLAKPLFTSVAPPSYVCGGGAASGALAALRGRGLRRRIGRKAHDQPVGNAEIDRDYVARQNALLAVELGEARQRPGRVRLGQLHLDPLIELEIPAALGDPDGRRHMAREIGHPREH